MKALNSSFINKTIPVVALLFAIPSTLFLGMPLVIIFAAAMTSRGENATLILLLVLLGFLGLFGLWLRAVAQPFFNESIFVKRAIGVLLLAGVIPAAFLVFTHINGPNQLSNASPDVAGFFYALVALGVTGLAMGIHNLWPNPAFERDAPKAARPSI